MIDFRTGTMRLDAATNEVVRWEVWFRTMEGLFKTLPEAVANADKIEMPVEMIRPVCVAIDGQGHYEECIR